MDSWPVLNNKPRTDNITTANVESTVQKYALPLDTTAFIMELVCEDNACVGWVKLAVVCANEMVFGCTPTAGCYHQVPG